MSIKSKQKRDSNKKKQRRLKDLIRDEKHRIASAQAKHGHLWRYYLGNSK